MRKRLLSQPVHHLLLLSFILLALIPVSLLGVKVYQAAWDNAWREIDEKHRLLATNLASPIGIYVSDHRAMLGLLAKSIKQVPADAAGNAANGRLLEMATSHLKGIQRAHAGRCRWPPACRGRRREQAGEPVGAAVRGGNLFRQHPQDRQMERSPASSADRSRESQRWS